MPFNLGPATRPTEWPSTVAITPKGGGLIANGLTTAKFYDGVHSVLYNAGIPQAEALTAIASSTAGGSSAGTYKVGVRFEDADGVVGSLSNFASVVNVAGRSFRYEDIPVSGESRVTKRSIWRTTVGQDRVAYLVTTVPDNSTIKLSGDANIDTYTDDQLRARAALPILDPEGGPNARRQGTPPTHMRCVISHGDFTFWSVPAKYSRGHAVVTNGSPTITIVGGTLYPSMIGRRLLIRGVEEDYTISNISGQTVTISENYGGPTDSFASYSIVPADEERNKVYVSYAGEPESIHALDAAVLSADFASTDDMTGMFSFGGIVWIGTHRNLYRWVYGSHPLKDGAIYHTENRGLLNPRCMARIENTLGIMDRSGIYLFDGGAANPISEPISDIFSPEVPGDIKIIWTRHEWFFAVPSPQDQSFKFFVCLDGSRYPRHSLTYHYRIQAWTIEEYPYEVSSACVIPSPVAHRVLLGGPYENLYLTGEGSQDHSPLKPHSCRFSVTSSTIISVTVSGADWDNGDILEGPILVVDGRGKGQQRKIVGADASTGRIDIDRPWIVMPDSTSIVAIGGIEWLWKTDVLDMIPAGGESKKVVTVVEPTAAPATLDYRFYRNREREPLAMLADHENASGMKSAKGSEWISGSMHRLRTSGEHDGVMQWVMDDSFDPRGAAQNRFLQVELHGVQERDRVIVYQVDVEGAV